jgi:hypothetical protein
MIRSLRNSVLPFLQHPSAWKWLLATAVLFRFAFLFASGLWKTEEYWEYGEIARLLSEGRGYSFPFVDEQLLFLKDAWYPSALMPPGYVFFLFPFFLIQNVVIRNLLLFTVQIGLSALAMLFSYRLVKDKAGVETGVVTLLFLAFTPDLVYASCSIGPTVWFHFLLSLFLWAPSGMRQPRSMVVQVLCAGLLVLMRSEVLLFFMAYAAWQWWKEYRFQAFTLLAGIAICLSPWLFRNYREFGKPVLSASAGVNFFRGNNPGEIGDWPNAWSDTVLKMREHPNTFESRFDALAMNQSLDWIRQNPGSWLLRMPEKLVRFWIIDWPDPRTLSPLYWIPWFTTFLLGLVGIRKKETRNQFLPHLILLAVYTLVILIFFPQLRYLTLVKFFWMPFAAVGVLNCLKIDKSKPH